MAVTLPTDAISTKFPTIGSVISAVLPYVYVIAGLAMLVMLIVGGITLMTAGGDQAKSKDGYGKISAAIIGFIIIFVAYFVAQIVQVVFGVKFL
ncbi:MAG: hypothetical protein WAV41_01155 [Microgenomates group bacterium]